jgi:FlaG/FlaF family flagellin (archaellin)
MVAITVILATVIGAFVLQIGNQTGDSAPTSQISVQDASSASAPLTAGTTDLDLLVVSHSGGDTIPAEDYEIRFREGDTSNNFVKLTSGSTVGYDIDDDGNDEISLSLANSQPDFGTGDEIVVHAEDETDSGDNHDYGGDKVDIQIIHTPSESLIVDTTVTVK